MWQFYQILSVIISYQHGYHTSASQLACSSTRSDGTRLIATQTDSKTVGKVRTQGTPQTAGSRQRHDDTERLTRHTTRHTLDF